MKRNEIPLDLTGFAEAVRDVEPMEQRLEEIDRAALAHWLELLPEPVTNTRVKRYKLRCV